MLDYQFTITIRPFRILKNLLVAAVVALMFVIPIPPRDQASVPAPSVAELSFQNAVQVVDRVLAERADFEPVERKALAETIVAESVKNGLDPLFVLAVIQSESGFDPHTPSIRCRVPGVESTCYANARGLMQVIPSTWKAEVKRRGLGKMDAGDSVDNVTIGIGYLAHLGTGFKRIGSLLWAYNQGPAMAMARARGVAPVGFTEERHAKAQEEGSAYEARVLKVYGKLLATHLNVTPTMKKMQALHRAPSSTVYTTLVGYSSDVRGVGDPRPVKVQKKARPVVVAEVP